MVALATSQRLVDDLGENGARNKNGPAEGATSPSHGPNNPTEGMAMDGQNHNSEAASAAIPFDFEAAFESLEDPIALASERIKVVDYVVAKMDGRKSQNGFRRIPDHEFDILLFMASEASASVRQIDKLWIKHNNDSVSIEREVELARRAS